MSVLRSSLFCSLAKTMQISVFSNRCWTIPVCSKMIPHLKLCDYVCVCACRARVFICMYLCSVRGSQLSHVLARSRLTSSVILLHRVSSRVRTHTHTNVLERVNMCRAPWLYNAIKVKWVLSFWFVYSLWCGMFVCPVCAASLFQ